MGDDDDDEDDDEDDYEGGGGMGGSAGDGEVDLLDMGGMTLGDAPQARAKVRIQSTRTL
jgi:hypothetical protein